MECLGYLNSTKKRRAIKSASANCRWKRHCIKTNTTHYVRIRCAAEVVVLRTNLQYDRKLHEVLPDPRSIMMQNVLRL